MRYLPLILLAGCVDPGTPVAQNAALADLPGLRVVATSGPSWGTGLFLRYDETAFREQTGYPCATLGDVDATFNGVRMTMSGGSWTEEDDFGDSYCNMPTFEGAYRIAPGDAAEVKLSDDTRAIVAHYAIDDLAWRSVDPTAQRWTFTSGEEAWFRWSHLDDITPFATVSAWYSDDQVYFEVPARVDGPASQLLLTFPAFTGSSNGELAIDLGADISGDAVDCIGADACTWNIETAYRHPARLLSI